MEAPLDPPLGPDDHVSGDPAAPLELVMYGDFECPYCAAAQSILERVKSRVGDDLRFAFRHFPLREIHPHAGQAAEAAEAAAAQGAFWPMHDKLFASRGRLEDRDLILHAGELGLDAERVARELRVHAHLARVERDLSYARRAGLTGTPAFYVNGRRFDGTYDARSLVDALKG